MNAVDTNVLIYVNDPRDPVKQALAASLVSSLTDGVLVWQVACEYLAASRTFYQMLDTNKILSSLLCKDLIKKRVSPFFLFGIAV